MTAQISDTFMYKSQKYYLAGLDGEGLITPQDYGMNPKMLHTACYRGFYSTYEITKDGLLLTEMVIGEVEEGYKPIQDIMPKLPNQNSDDYPTEDFPPDTTYKGLKLLTPFTGRMRLGKDFIQKLYIHMGYQKATAYKTLLEFTFEAGKLVSLQDLSADNAKKRGSFKKAWLENGIGQGIENSFSLDIDIE